MKGGGLHLKEYDGSIPLTIVLEGNVLFERCVIRQCVISGGRLAADKSVFLTLKLNKVAFSFLGHTLISNLDMKDSAANMVNVSVTNLVIDHATINGEGCHFINIDDNGGSKLNVAGAGTPPRKGAFILWDKAYHRKEGECLVKLFVPAGARRLGVFRVRVGKVKVLSITSLKTGQQLKKAQAVYSDTINYKRGSWIKSKFDPRYTTRANGICGFLSKEMALNYTP